MSIRKIIGNLIGWFCILWWRVFYRTKDGTIFSIYFHNPTGKVFEGVVKFLKKRGYRFLSINDSLQNVKGKCALITLDDAWQNNLTNVIPVVEKYQIPITIFVAVQPLHDGVLWLSWFRDKGLYDGIDPKKLTTATRDKIWAEIKPKKDFARKIMTSEQVAQIAKNPLVTIGSHTLSHPILPLCTDKELETELAESKIYLEDLISRSVASFAYPNGDYDKRVIQATQQAGYKIAFTTENRLLKPTDNLYCLPRYSVPNAYGKWESIARAIGIGSKYIKYESSYSKK